MGEISQPADSKQYAETGAEWQELIRRHCCIIDELRDEFGGGNLMVLAQDYPRRDAAHGWTKRALPESWLWKTLEPDDEKDDRSFIRVSRTFAGSGGLTALIRLIANDEGAAGSCIVTDESVGWLYGPYPGGGDAIAPTASARDTLRDRHAEWLSARADGL
ncbi:DUF3885 domain-containing protein [Subtercola endophyticus]|uniref:DUF3885 domain-containing protein n=1 Tax=Subtercola endophyticus TaxID=2895559 RepID=UPI001E4039BA|nr:hypothetical protein [Subtercola endophyticus]UFS59756.1 hypothetical protein LQ955_02865 [Subtercola endophyticus]